MKNLLIIMMMSLLFFPLTHCGDTKDQAPKKDENAEQTADPSATAETPAPSEQQPEDPELAKTLSVVDLVAGVYTGMADVQYDFKTLTKGADHPVKILINYNMSNIPKFIVRFESLAQTEEVSPQFFCTMYSNFTILSEGGYQLVHTFKGASVINTGKIKSAEKVHSIVLSENTINQMNNNILTIKIQNRWETVKNIKKQEEPTPSFEALYNSCNISEQVN